MSTKPRVSIVMGSDSDLEIMREAAKALEEFGIAYEIDVTSAHRSPERTAEYARKAAGRGIRVIIAGAGGAAHLAGVIAAHTTLPVIGVPIPRLRCMAWIRCWRRCKCRRAFRWRRSLSASRARPMREFWRRKFWRFPMPACKKLAAHKEKLANGVEEKSRKLKITLGTS